MKNLYLFIAIAVGLSASIIIYTTAQGEDEATFKLLSRTSKSISRGLAACKNATYDLDGFQFMLANGKVVIDSDREGAPNGVMTYAQHAVRGSMNGDAYNDMVCLYTLEKPDNTKALYVGVLLGGEGQQFLVSHMLKVADAVNPLEVAITGGVGTATYSSLVPGESSGPLSRSFYLEGDTLTFR